MQSSYIIIYMFFFFFISDESAVAEFVKEVINHVCEKIESDAAERDSKHTIYNIDQQVYNWM